ncbi:hypothetical protein IPA_02950 [Ignicoccus pacificus DSM 13166]|uniref:Uncharacterized protein n=1 Tax=Ignicoccus pacificus DSM 13166 TaxID=940294 RepID=A0A977KAT4_9CREN|nr:hypothetical protein IPA_02950 [Ignicoccus pacificus DSM 13166]
MRRGIATLEVLLLMSGVIVAATILMGWLLRAKPNTDTRMIIISIETIAKSTTLPLLSSVYSKGASIMIINNKVIVFQQRYKVILVPSSGNVTVVGKVLLGSGCVKGVIVKDLLGNVIVLKEFNKTYCLSTGDVIVAQLNVPISKFGKIEFFGPSKVRNINTWMTQVR